ncbi:MAG TPA: haloacid dehalogenase-like hydrolase [Streptomyces sp.]|jgi:phosphoserine phosphatase|nr:haloacid dehalogenase-like hydrolase [Streptomyces sp.]
MAPPPYPPSPSGPPAVPHQKSGRSRLHLFDLDGTLIHGSSAALEISRQLGLDVEIRELELAFAAGGMTPPDFAERACALWSELTDAHVEAAFTEAPWLAGIREVWEEIRERGEHCAVISLSPDFFVGRLLLQAPPSPAGGMGGRGADAAHGSRWPAVPFREPIDRAGILSAAAKVRIADELCLRFGVSRSDCVAYGDSMSDVELFAAVPLSVAVNADRHVRGRASLEYEGRDLREAYGLVRTGR